MAVPAAATAPVVLTKLRRELSLGEGVLVSLMVRQVVGTVVVRFEKRVSGHHPCQNGGWGDILFR